MKIGLGGMILLDASFRHTIDPLSSHGKRVNPPAEAPMEVGLLKGEQPNTYAVTLRVGLEAADALYAVSVGYAVILTVDLEDEAPPTDLDNRVMVTGATMALPFVRELIANMTGRGRFGTTWVNPTNFSNLFPKPQNAETTPATK